MEETLNIESPESTMPGIVFTDAAARKVQELVLEEGNPDLKLRVYISGGGCSGFQYGFSGSTGRWPRAASRAGAPGQP